MIFHLHQMLCHPFLSSAHEFAGLLFSPRSMLEAKAILREAPTNIAGGFRKPIKLEQHRTIVSARFAGSFPPIRVAKLCARLTVSHIFCMHSDRVVKSLPPPQLCCHHSCAICSTLFILYNLIRHCQYICF